MLHKRRGRKINYIVFLRENSHDVLDRSNINEKFYIENWAWKNSLPVVSAPRPVDMHANVNKRETIASAIYTGPFMEIRSSRYESIGHENGLNAIRTYIIWLLFTNMYCRIKYRNMKNIDISVNSIVYWYINTVEIM